MKEDKIINVNSLLYEEFAADDDVVVKPEPTTPRPTTAAPCACCFTTEVPVNYERCQLTADRTIETTVNCVGRFLDVNVTLRNVCPNKFVNVGVLVYEGTRLVTFKVCRFFTNGGTDCIPSVNAGRFCFVFDEPSCPPARTFTVRVVANYVKNLLDS